MYIRKMSTISLCLRGPRKAFCSWTHEQTVIFWFRCLLCLRPRLTVLLCLAKPHHVDQTRSSNQFFLTSAERGWCKTFFFFCGLLTVSGVTVDFSQKEWQCLDLSIEGICIGTRCCKMAAVWFLCLWFIYLLSPLLLLGISWQTDLCGLWVNGSHIPQSKVKPSKEKRKFSWGVLSSSCVSLWEV